jgi:hypothetical protein
MKDKTQHRLGQHYSKEEKLIINYTDILKENKNKIIVDPFVGEGHLLFFYLNLFTKEEQLFLLNNKMIRGYDLFESNIIFIKEKVKELYALEDNLINELFQVRDSLLDNYLPENSFILTNPPYLAKNVCKQKYPEDFNKYFLNLYKEKNDYFEIALNLYNNHNGIWIIPSNIISSDIMKKTRKNIINKLTDIFVYEEKIFEDTDISVVSFYLNTYIFLNKINITFVNNKRNLNKEFHIIDYNIVNEWEIIKKTKNKNNIKHGYINTKINKGDFKVVVLDESYKEKEISVSEEDYLKLNNNILIIRTTDTGTKNGEIGLYTIEEIWKNKNAKGLITKISSRVYTQLFINLSIEDQLLLKKIFNLKLNELREQYNSVFLTNFKNSSNGKQRKRISFKEVFSLINLILEEHFLN